MKDVGLIPCKFSETLVEKFAASYQYFKNI